MSCRDTPVSPVVTQVITPTSAISATNVKTTAPSAHPHNSAPPVKRTSAFLMVLATQSVPWLPTPTTKCVFLVLRTAHSVTLHNNVVNVRMGHHCAVASAWMDALSDCILLTSPVSLARTIASNAPPLQTALNACQPHFSTRARALINAQPRRSPSGESADHAILTVKFVSHPSIAIPATKDSSWIPTTAPACHLVLPNTFPTITQHVRNAPRAAPCAKTPPPVLSAPHPTSSSISSA